MKAKQQKSFINPSALQDAMKKASSTNVNIKKVRKKFIFTIKGSECEAGVFCDEQENYFDFEITLSPTTAAQEAKIMSRAQDASIAIEYAKACIYEVNAKEITESERDFLWSNIGMGYRTAILTAYGQLGLGANNADSFLATMREA